MNARPKGKPKMTIVANQYTHVIGVDTHAKNHTYAILASATGQVVDTATCPATEQGTAHDCPDAGAVLRRNAAICGAADRGGLNPKRDPPVPQTRYRPATLQETSNPYGLIRSIEGSEVDCTNVRSHAHWPDF